MDRVLRISVLFWVVIGRVCAEICSSSGFYTRFCEDDKYCCGNGYSCCSKAILSVGAIIGIVIGCIFFLSICIGVVICIAQSQNHRPGRVIQPATGGQSIAVVGLQNTQQQTSYQQPQHYQPAHGYPAGQLLPGQAYPPPPPAYNSNLYSQSMQPGPAYPPATGSNTESGANIIPAKQ